MVALFGTIRVLFRGRDMLRDNGEASDNHFSGAPLPLPCTVLSEATLAALFQQQFVGTPPDFQIDPVFFYP